MHATERLRAGCRRVLCLGVCLPKFCRVVYFRRVYFIAHSPGYNLGVGGLWCVDCAWEPSRTLCCSGIRTEEIASFLVFRFLVCSISNGLY